MDQRYCRLSKGPEALVRRDAEGVDEAIELGYSLEGECDEEGKVLSPGVNPFAGEKKPKDKKDKKKPKGQQEPGADEEGDEEGEPDLGGGDSQE